MAPGFDSKIFFCILFITCYCTVTLAQIPIDCCLQVSNQQVDRSVVVDYRQQIGGRGCAIDATILVTRRGKILCVSADGLWLRKLKNHVDNLKKDCKTSNYKGRRCVGVKRE